jgi:hypothetical protein
MRRPLFPAAVFALLLVALAPGVVLAKFPPFSVEVDPEQPRSGQPVTITVRTWEDTAHTVVADWDFSSPMDGVVALYPRGDAGDDAGSDAEGDPSSDAGGDADAGRIDVQLEEIAPGRLAATLGPLASGTWVLRAFPDRSAGERMPPGYPDEVTFTVAPAEDALGPFVVVSGAGFAGLFVALVAVRRQRRPPM